MPWISAKPSATFGIAQPSFQPSKRLHHKEIEWPLLLAAMTQNGKLQFLGLFSGYLVPFADRQFLSKMKENITKMFLKVLLFGAPFSLVVVL